MTSNLDILHQVAREKGASPLVLDYLERTMDVESGGRAGAKNSGSTAKGLFQFIDSTWAGLVKKHPTELTMDGRKDPRQQSIAAIYFTNDNAASLRRAGNEVTAGNLYLAHFLGDGGANKALSANPSAQVEDVLGQGVVDSNRGITLKYRDRNDVEKKKSFTQFTTGDLRAWATKKMGGRIRYDLLDREVQSDVERWDGDNENPRNNFRAEGELTFAQVVVAALIGFIAKAMGFDGHFSDASVLTPPKTPLPQTVHAARSAPSPTIRGA